MFEGCEEAGAETVLEEGVFGVVFVETPLDAKEAFSNATNDLAGLRDCFFDGYWDLVFELDSVAQAVVDVEIRDLVGASGGIVVAYEAEIDLPVLVSWGFGVVCAKGWASLGVGQKGG